MRASGSVMKKEPEKKWDQAVHGEEDKRQDEMREGVNGGGEKNATK